MTDMRPGSDIDILANLFLGDNVVKIKGYAFPGTIVADFCTLSGERRLVVECTADEVAGCLHIFSPDQVRKIKRNVAR